MVRVFRSLALVSGTAAAASCSVELDMDYVGADVASTPASTPDECCAACSANADCVVGVHMGTVCYMKSSKGSPSPKSTGRIALTPGGAPAPSPTPPPTPSPPPSPAPSPVGDDPNWGCGLLGFLPGIKADGSKTSEMQRLIDGIKGASSYGKPSYWNWGLSPDGVQPLSEDFIFMPENWGAGVVKLGELQEAGLVGVKDVSGAATPATMAEILLGTNEPDITGSCQGCEGCTAPCTGGENDAGVCPVADPANPSKANSVGHCDCWSKSSATSAGFWSSDGCRDPQPLPDLWNDTICVKSVMNAWKVSAVDVAVQKGYRFLSTPLMAYNMDWLRNFVEHACKDCSDVSCGCPTHLGWHMYSYDCRPESLGGYADFQRKLDASRAIMEDFPQIKGVIINEVGMLDGCTGDGCVPQYPAKDQPGHTCPSTDELPDGLGGYLEKLLDLASKAKTKDGRRVVKGFSWFNEDQVGGSYDIRIVDETGKLNAIGESFIRGCQAWASSLSEDMLV